MATAIGFCRDARIIVAGICFLVRLVAAFFRAVLSVHCLATIGSPDWFQGLPFVSSRFGSGAWLRTVLAL